jgi:hypothetical protein
LYILPAEKNFQSTTSLALKSAMRSGLGVVTCGVVRSSQME